MADVQCWKALVLLLLSSFARSVSLRTPVVSSVVDDRRRLEEAGSRANPQLMRVSITLTRDTPTTFTLDKQKALLGVFAESSVYNLREGRSKLGKSSSRGFRRQITAISTLDGAEMVRCVTATMAYPCPLWDSGEEHNSGLKIFFELEAPKPLMHAVLSAIENGQLAVILRDKLIGVDGLNEYVTFAIPAGN